MDHLAAIEAGVAALDDAILELARAYVEADADGKRALRLKFPALPHSEFPGHPHTSFWRDCEADAATGTVRETAPHIATLRSMCGR